MVDQHLEFAVLGNLPCEIVRLARHLDLEMHRKRTGSLERVAADNHRIGLVVDMLHLIDVGSIGEDIVLSRLVSGEMMGAG